MKTLTELHPTLIKAAHATYSQKKRELTPPPTQASKKTPKTAEPVIEAAPSAPAPTEAGDAPAPAPEAVLAEAAKPTPLSPEEIQSQLSTALQEAHSLEGDRLTYVQNALELLSNRVEGLKRVIVLSLAENEKAPKGALKKGDLYYVIEYFPSAQPKAAPPRFAGRGEGRDGKRKGRGKGKRRDDRAGERREGTGAGRPPEGEGGEKRRRPFFKKRPEAGQQRPEASQPRSAGPAVVPRPKSTTTPTT